MQTAAHLIIAALAAYAAWLLCGLASWHYWTAHGIPRNRESLHDCLLAGAVSLAIAMDDMRARRRAKRRKAE